MNDERIKFKLDEIEHDINNDTYIFSESTRNQLCVAINQLREKIFAEYDKIKQTMTL